MDGSHPRFELVGEVTGQKTDLLAPNGNQRTIDRNPSISAQLEHLFEGGGERKKRLAGTRHTHHRTGRYIGIHEEIERKRLSHVLGFHAEDVATTRYPCDGCAMSVVDNPAESRL